MRKKRKPEQICNFNPMIEAKNLSKTYGSLAVLNGVDLQVKTKEIVAITGPSGAGKTTLLNILGTLDMADHQPDRKLLIGGQDVFSLQGKELAKISKSAARFCVSISSTPSRI